MNLHDEQLERSAIASMCDLALSDLGAARALLENHPLKADALYLPAHRDTLTAVAGLIRRRAAPTLAAIWAELADSQAAQEKGRQWLQATLESDFATGTPQWAHHVAALTALANRRAVVDLARKVADQAKDPSQDATALALVAARAFGRLESGGGRLETLQTDWGELMDDLDKAQRGEREVCLSTGVAIWDRTVGGLLPGVLTFIGAQPGVGKSALMARMLINLASRGLKVGLLSLEDAPKWLSRRAIAEASGVPVHALATRRLSNDDREAVGAAAERVVSWHGNVVRQAPARMTPDAVALVARRMVLEHKARAIFLDHLGEIETGARKERYDLGVNDAVVALRDVAIDCNVPVVVAAHFHRPRGNNDNEVKYQKPTTTSWGESAYVERKARVAVGMWAEEGSNQRVNAVVLKNTLGPPGECFWMPFNGGSSLIQSEGGGRLAEAE